MVGKHRGFGMVSGSFCGFIVVTVGSMTEHLTRVIFYVINGLVSGSILWFSSDE